MMSRRNNEERVMPETVRLNNTAIEHCMQQDDMIVNQEYVNNNKLAESIRILALNPRGINPWDNSKTQRLTEIINNLQIDVILLNKTNIK